MTDGFERLAARLRATAFELTEIESDLANLAGRQCIAEQQVDILPFLTAYRRAREKVFGASSASYEPCWLILADMLRIERDSGEPYRTKYAAEASGLSPTTALRYVHDLEKQGLIERTRENADGRVVELRLTPAAKKSINSVLALLSAQFCNFERAM